jgi:hypothetical protein
MITVGDRLDDLCTRFVTEQRITCSECVYQSDRVIENAYQLIDDICKIVGFYTDPEGYGDE